MSHVSALDPAVPRAETCPTNTFLMCKDAQLGKGAPSAARVTMTTEALRWSHIVKGH